MRHPTEPDLALYAGGDLSFWSRRHVARHLRECAPCREAVEAFREAAAEMRGEAVELPAGLNWTRLAAEMKANIRLGFAAGELVRPLPAHAFHFGMRQAMATASIVILVLAGLWLNLPQPRPSRPETAGIVLEQTAAGIELQENGRTLTMRVPRDGVLLSVSAKGSMGARYVDSETGQVTISNVYIQ